MYKKICTVYLTLPVILFFITNLLLSCYIGLTINWSKVIIETLLLLGITVFLSLNGKKYNIIGIMFLAIHLAYNFYLEYTEMLKKSEFETFISGKYIYIGITIYYLVIFTLKIIPFKNNIKDK